MTSQLKPAIIIQMWRNPPKEMATATPTIFPKPTAIEKRRCQCLKMRNFSN